MIRYVVSTLFLGLILFYGVLTLVFVSPNNFLNISLTKGEIFFNIFFSQKWGFFAPPPNYDERLYFIYENKFLKKDVKYYEVLGPLMAEKSKNAPFNSKYDVLDYLISNSVNNICDILINTNKIKAYEIKKKIEKHKDYDIFASSKETVKSSNSFKTLINYSKYIANSNSLNPCNYKISLKLTRKIINKFNDRNKQNIIKEQLIFESELN